MKKKILMLVLATTMLVSCYSKERDSFSIFYNPYIQKLIKYNESTKMTKLSNETQNQFQFSISGSDELFIDGNSTNNQYKLIRVTLDNVDSVKEFEKGHGVFPISISENTIYFIHTQYNENGEENYSKRHVAEYNISTDNLKDFVLTSGLINYATFMDGYIYYSVYDEKIDMYSIFKINIDGNIETNKPQLVKKNLKEGDIYSQNSTLYLSTERSIFSDEKDYKKEPVNIFYDVFLVQFYFNVNGELCVRIIDTVSEKTVFEKEKVEGIRYAGKYLLFLVDNEVVRYELEMLKALEIGLS